MTNRTSRAEEMLSRSEEMRLLIRPVTFVCIEGVVIRGIEGAAGSEFAGRAGGSVASDVPGSKPCATSASKVEGSGLVILVGVPIAVVVAVVALKAGPSSCSRILSECSYTSWVRIASICTDTADFSRGMVKVG